MTTAPVPSLHIELPGIGEPESLLPRVRDVAEPGPGQARIQVLAAGISFAEQQMRLGKYYDQPPFPFVPGYDLVGVVEHLGPATGATPAGIHLGARVAAVTKTGAWAEHVLLDVDDLVPVPDGLDAPSAESLVVNGLTAWRMLHRVARPPARSWVVVLGAAGGVGSILVQLALAAGLRVIGVGSATQQAAITAQGAVALDYRSDDVPARVRDHAPDGVAAVFDHVGGSGLTASWGMLARRGRLVSYGSASTKDHPGSSRLPVLALFGRLLVWNVMPNGRRATFFNLWAGRRKAERFRRELRADLEEVFALAAAGRLQARVAASFPLADAGAGLRFAEQGGLVGKVVLVAGPTNPEGLRVEASRP